MTTEENKFEMEQYTKMVEKYKPTKALIDTLQFGFIIAPKVQEWTNENLFPRILALGVKRVAILLPEEIVLQLALEQVMTESLGIEFETKYFSNEAEARSWLLS